MTGQRWDLDVEGRHHRVEADGSTRHRVRWYVDDQLVAERTAMEDKIRLRPSGDAAGHGLGAVLVRFSTLGAPRRATRLPPDEALDVQLSTGVGGTDLVPERGSKAAQHDERMLAHPTRYTVIQTAGGVATVVVPLLVAALLARLAFSFDWPAIPWPDLPDIPWPEIRLPGIPLPNWSLPGWVREALGYAKYVWPVLLAFLLARAEIRRRRTQRAVR
ncbi:hypothetical protein SFC88_03310 [Nocardioides sp. HM23]|uniref:hypothetical protein n=1 Tax=Nocardioides bizhenqiangii TaxID=3095076 RepID=UPI002ACA2D05|nr:hypothetical protein [Nocardioides sp. HM23]MDZ5619836.1 hypothetical protein [Nocardioides sp. HM23]